MWHMALLFSSPVRVFILSFTQSVTENAKLHQHSSLGRDIFILMHKQALTQHPRGEKTRIIFSDVAMPKACCRHKQCRCKQTPVCVWEAHFQQPVGWGCLVSSITWCTTCDLFLQHLEHAASCFPLHAPHHIYILFAILNSSVASQLLPCTCILGSMPPVALSLASLCHILYLMYKINVASSPSFSPCPILPRIKYVFSLKSDVGLFVCCDTPASASQLFLPFRS